MRPHWLTMLFTKHCPLCQAAVWKGAAGVVRGLGRLYCCQVHADTHEQRQDTARHDFHRRHATCHGDNRLLPSAGEDKPCYEPRSRGAPMRRVKIDEWGVGNDVGLE
jgi:hypothetical protein